MQPDHEVTGGSSGSPLPPVGGGGGQRPKAVGRSGWAGGLGRRELILGAGALLAGARPVVATGQEGVEFVGVDEVRKLQQTAKRPLLIDVRSADEFRDGHIAGAVNIPLSEFERRRGEVPRQGLVVLY